MTEVSTSSCEVLATPADGTSAPVAPWYGTVAIASVLLAVPLLIGFVAITDPFAMGLRRDNGQAQLSDTVGAPTASEAATVQPASKAGAADADPVGRAQLRLTTI
jgi:hypothetical protein